MYYYYLIMELIDGKDYKVWTIQGYMGVWTWVEEKNSFMALFSLNGNPSCLALPQEPLRWKLDVSQKVKLF